jgi:hypothetical protein
MITEKELKERCTPDIIRKIVELAEGFEYQEDGGHTCKIINYRKYKIFYELDMRYCDIFPLLIHRAVEGWNKAKISYRDGIIIYDSYIELWLDGFNKEYDAKTYRPDSLTALECALLDCLVEVLG